jgi:hypothetical protein
MAGDEGCGQTGMTGPTTDRDRSAVIIGWDDPNASEVWRPPWISTPSGYADTSCERSQVTPTIRLFIALPSSRRPGARWSETPHSARRASASLG